jgi:transcriptional antiterminator NusG
MAAESSAGEPLKPEERSHEERAGEEPAEVIADRAKEAAEAVAAEELVEITEAEAPGADEPAPEPAAATTEQAAAVIEPAVEPQPGASEEVAELAAEPESVVEPVEEEVAEEAVAEEAVAEPAEEVAAREEQPALEEQAAVEEEPAAASTNGKSPAGTVGVPGMDWYIIHSYSGFENKVRESLRTRADAFGFGERIGEILIPTEDVVEMRNGKKVTSKRLIYPGYVLVQLKLDDELWHVVKNTPRVTGFVGGGQTPAPLSADEVNQILYRQTSSEERPRPKLSFDKNDRVKIIDGPFTNFTGAVEEVNTDRNTLKVMVTIFGRSTPVELEYFQVEKEQV